MNATSRRLACAFSLMVALQAPTVCAFAASQTPPVKASTVDIWWPGGRVTPTAPAGCGSAAASTVLDLTGCGGAVQAPYLGV